MIAMRPTVRSTGLVIALLIAAGSAEAQLSSAEQRCIDGYNNKLRLVAQQKGKDITTCVKDWVHGKLMGEDQDQCVAKVAPGTQGALEKVSRLYKSDTCTGTEPIQMGAYAGTTAYVGGMIGLTHDLLGTPISTWPGSSEAKCKEKVVKRTVQTFVEQVRVFRNCCRDLMRSGDVIDSTSLTASECMSKPSNTKDTKSAQKLYDALQGRCLGLSRASIFAGLASGCSSTVLATRDCIVHRIDCRICQTVNAADGTSRDCDLFDDGLLNLSCIP